MCLEGRAATAPARAETAPAALVDSTTPLLPRETAAEARQAVVTANPSPAAVNTNPRLVWGADPESGVGMPQLAVSPEASSAPAHGNTTRPIHRYRPRVLSWQSIIDDWKIRAGRGDVNVQEAWTRFTGTPWLCMVSSYSACVVNAIGLANCLRTQHVNSSHSEHLESHNFLHNVFELAVNILVLRIIQQGLQFWSGEMFKKMKAMVATGSTGEALNLSPWQTVTWLTRIGPVTLLCTAFAHILSTGSFPLSTSNLLAIVLDPMLNDSHSKPLQNAMNATDLGGGSSVTAQDYTCTAMIVLGRCLMYVQWLAMSLQAAQQLREVCSKAIAKQQSHNHSQLSQLEEVAHDAHVETITNAMEEDMSLIKTTTLFLSFQHAGKLYAYVMGVFSVMIAVSGMNAMEWQLGKEHTVDLQILRDAFQMLLGVLCLSNVLAPLATTTKEMRALAKDWEKAQKKWDKKHALDPRSRIENQIEEHAHKLQAAAVKLLWVEITPEAAMRFGFQLKAALASIYMYFVMVWQRLH